jgi:hypothetical protein
VVLDKNETRREDDVPKKWGRYDKTLEERKTVLDESFWQDFTLLARVCYMHDPESTIYDVFDTMRTKVLGGWEFTDEFVAKIDAQIEDEENAKLARDSN